jgi:hypothetical protein
MFSLVDAFLQVPEQSKIVKIHGLIYRQLLVLLLSATGAEDPIINVSTSIDSRVGESERWRRPESQQLKSVQSEVIWSRYR